MIGVEKCKTPVDAFYRSDAVTHSNVKVAECAKAAHQLASLNAKFLAKFNYATDYAGNISVTWSLMMICLSSFILRLSRDMKN